MPELIPWLGVTAVLAIGVFVQAAAGFAAGMLIVPTLLWMGYAIPEASMALLVATIPQNLFGVYSLRDSIVPKRLLWPGLGRLMFFPIGIVALIAIEHSFPTERIRQFVGGVVLVATLATIFYRPVPREKLSPIWSWIAFPLSGFLQGLVGMGGPAMVFWVSAHDWNTRQIRGFLFAMYLISLAPAIVMLFLFFGTRLIDPAVGALAAIPILLLVTSVGLKFGNWLGRERLRGVTLVLLMLMGVVGLASPWIRAN
ncbi:sulfite exporter TauE/SafE family protein [Stieleria sp. TO1_6]|uniref:sulfite exporter TauE/SafE family protein n=1 Tax=Stieleria tagensis TaxID=2956795 RepID=UPI00209B8076|nr:sulfite exporter TauE/SafE family protein [Stieleria tagensis]MCO8120632.1 sulfite exporter TauE/SafE family protein [Stieleria tagensis]